MSRHKLPIVFFLSLLILPMSVNAQTRYDQAIISMTKSIAKNCLDGRWTSSRCLIAQAYSNKMMAANFMAKLRGSNQAEAAEHIKNNCAAASVLDKQKGLTKDVITSAMNECINSVADVHKTTLMHPNLNHFQVVLATTYCYNAEANIQCQHVEDSLERYR